MTIPIDALDRKILSIIQVDARVPAEAIGLNVGLSASAVQRRIARLREMGVITGDVVLVDQRKLGQALTTVVDIEVESERPELMAPFSDWIRKQACVQDAWCVTGHFDFVVVVVSADVDSFERWTRHLVAENKNVRRFHTRVALASIKRGCIPIGPP
jgi:Lrp/AsnC family leucine-responsive transcriptional regulator